MPPTLPNYLSAAMPGTIMVTVTDSALLDKGAFSLVLLDLSSTTKCDQMHSNDCCKFGHT
jgi:hypothetical protein